MARVPVRPWAAQVDSTVQVSGDLFVAFFTVAVSIGVPALCAGWQPLRDATGFAWGPVSGGLAVALLVSGVFDVFVWPRVSVTTRVVAMTCTSGIFLTYALSLALGSATQGGFGLFMAIALLIAFAHSWQMLLTVRTPGFWLYWGVTALLALAVFPFEPKLLVMAFVAISIGVATGEIALRRRWTELRVAQMRVEAAALASLQRGQNALASSLIRNTHQLRVRLSPARSAMQHALQKLDGHPAYGEVAAAFAAVEESLAVELAPERLGEHVSIASVHLSAVVGDVYDAIRNDVSMRVNVLSTSAGPGTTVLVDGGRQAAFTMLQALARGSVGAGARTLYFQSMAADSADSAKLVVRDDGPLVPVGVCDALARADGEEALEAAVRDGELGERGAAFLMAHAVATSSGGRFEIENEVDDGHRGVRVTLVLPQVVASDADFPHDDDYHRQIWNARRTAAGLPAMKPSLRLIPTAPSSGG